MAFAIDAGSRATPIGNVAKATLALALAAVLGPVGAAEYRQVQPGKSNIGFSYKQMGVAVDGHFRKFSSELRFDPAKPANARVVLDVDLASVDAGSADADQEVAGREWFNTKAFPAARFVSSSVKPLGDNRYEVAGRLTIKGQSREIVVPTRFTPAGSSGAFEGAFNLRRGDFSIGEGAWSKFDIVANEVQVKFRITATQ